MVRESSSSYKIDDVIVIENFLNPEGHPNLISGSKVTAIITEGLDFAYWWSFSGRGSALQPVQQACFKRLQIHKYTPYKSVTDEQTNKQSLATPTLGPDWASQLA